MLWLVRSDGVLVSLTYDREQQVRAWCRHEMGGEGAVESVAVVPDPDGINDDVYVAVRRTVNGATVRYVEWMRPPFRADLEAAADGFFVDCGLSYEGGPTNLVTGLDHLEGCDVAICADGALRPTATVQGGYVTVPAPRASVIHVGLPYTSRLKTLPAEVNVGNGSSAGMMKRIARAHVRLHESMGGRLGRDGAMEEMYFRTPFDAMGEAVPLFTGVKEVDFPAGPDTNGQVIIETDAALPLTVLSVVTEVSVSGG